MIIRQYGRLDDFKEEILGISLTDLDFEDGTFHVAGSKEELKN